MFFKNILILVLLNLYLFSNNLIEVVLPNNKWKLIGVPGAFMENTIDGITTNSWIWGYESETDNNTTDGKWTGLIANGTSAEYSATTHLAGISVVNSDYKKVTVSINHNSTSVDITLPRRTVFIDSDNDGTADINITYQSNLEGQQFNIRIIKKDNSQNDYYGYLNSAYGEVNPLSLNLITGTSNTYYFTIRDILDMNLSNNPGKAGQSGEIKDYQKIYHKDNLDSNDYLLVFRLDSNYSTWESFNSRIADDSNDFTTLVSGSAYWMKLHDDTEDTTKHGLILGDNNISLDTYSDKSLSSTNKTSRSSTVAHKLLAEGWNMLSFPNGVIRHSGTGLMLTKKSPAPNNEFYIKDEVGKESITVKLYDIDHDGSISIQELAQSINLSIGAALNSDSVSDNFNVRAFDYNNSIILLSDRKFRVYEKSSVDIFGEVKTIGNQNPYNFATSSYSAVTDLGDVGVASKYGEFGLVITITNGGDGNVSGVLNSANQDIGKIRINDNDPVSVNPTTHNKVDKIDISSKDSDIASQLILDLDLNDNNDSILLMGTSPFYIRDNTFVKVYRLDGTPTDEGVQIYVNEGDGTLTEVEIGIASTTATNLTYDDFKAKNVGNYIYLATTESTKRTFDLKEKGNDDNLTRVISNNDLAFGAVKEVYSVSNLGQSDINKSVFILDFNGSTTQEGDDLNISINGENIDCVVGDDDNAGNICINCAAKINSESSQNVIAECNTTTKTDKNARITLTGYFATATFDMNNTGEELDLNISNVGAIKDHNCSRFWEKNSTGGVALQDTETLTDDLTYIPIFTPDFPTRDNVLKYIRNNGFVAKKMLTAVNDSAGNISWKYIDLTVNPDNWFDEVYDHSLFSVEQEKGYFVYLEEENESKKITLSNDDILFNLSYFQHYNNDKNDVDLAKGGQVDNFFQGTLQVIPDDNEGEKTQVVATIQNKDYKLIQNGSYYTLEINRANLPDIAMIDSEITITAYNEKGTKASQTVDFNLAVPAKPVLQFVSGKHIFIGTTSSGVKSFNIYKGVIPDNDPTPVNKDGSNFIRNLNSSNDYKTATNQNPDYGNTNDEFGATSLTLNGVDYSEDPNSNPNPTINYKNNEIGNVYIKNTSYPKYYFFIYNICADATSFDSNNTTWEVVSIIGDGNSSHSLVSDITFIPDWYPIYKNASILEVNGTTGDTNNTPALYDSDCVLTSRSGGNNGVVLIDANDTLGDKIEIAYDTISQSSIGSGIPYETYICKDGGKKETDYLAKIQFAENVYVTSENPNLDSPQVVIIEYEHDTTHKMYKTTFDDLHEVSTGDCFYLKSSMEIGATGQSIIGGM